MRALKILLPTFAVILAINQAAYGMCFEAYCLAAALPKVIVLSVIVSAFIYWVSKNDKRS